MVFKSRTRECQLNNHYVSLIEGILITRTIIEEISIKEHIIFLYKNRKVIGSKKT